jgi:primosomal protein N' (replication factor Y) (superfamily II helicase)
MKYAEVAVNAPGGHRHAFTYSTPPSLDVRAGQGVWAPFGARTVKGIVTGLSDHASVEATRDLISVINGVPLLSEQRINLAKWIASYYLAPLFESVALMLPPGFERNTQIKPKIIRYLSLSIDGEEAAAVIAALRKRRSLRQARVLEILLAARSRLPASDVLARAGCNRSVLKPLLDKHIITELGEATRRDPLDKRDLPLELPFTFTGGQLAAWQPIKESLNTVGQSGRNGVFLLHGVTGSGKTEIYLQALAEAIRLGKKGICLVPEISLTPQTVERFFSRFPGRVALLHSKLSPGEQFDEWQRIHEGGSDIVVGPRSAIFAPQPGLGLIIVDEEHEWAYKQTDKMPRYHAREVAVELARLTGATLILGSATPDVESYQRTANKQFSLIELKDRVTPLGASSLPEVTIVNMRNEFKAGNRGIFSRLLRAEIGAALEKREQVILFVNRRGLSTFVQCRNCGYVPACRQCTGTLTYHAYNNKLVCHHCRRTYPRLNICPVCSSTDIKYFGMGTESVEAECRELFPAAAVIRLDSDAVTRARDYEQAMRAFRSRTVDIMIGTQLVAKGLDFPGVSLVGVVNADTNINLPDFRAGERTFQLLCQVEGRAGRGIAAGKAVVQTYNPDYYAIKYAARHDYAGFYDQEMKYRKRFGYPPFNDMVRLVYVNTNNEKCRNESARMAALLQTEIAVIGTAGIRVIGPTPAFIQRLRGKYQMQLILLGHELQPLLTRISFPRGWILDVDPVGMI